MCRGIWFRGGVCGDDVDTGILHGTCGGDVDTGIPDGTCGGDDKGMLYGTYDGDVDTGMLYGICGGDVDTGIPDGICCGDRFCPNKVFGLTILTGDDLLVASKAK